MAELQLGLIILALRIPMLWEGQMRLFFRPSLYAEACFGSSESG